MSHIEFPDLSQYTPVSLAGAPLAIARATISTVKDSHWDTFVADARARGVPLLAYCFINSGRLGVSPEAQADFAFSVVGTRPTMLDHEPNRGQCATLDESCRWIDRFRSRGGVTKLDYLPHWSWQGSMGSPRLDPLAARGMVLVSSSYTTYSDGGPGWAPYYPGCPVPVAQWQFADSHLFNGARVDWNAIRIPVDTYLSTMAGAVDMPTDAQWQQFQKQWEAFYQGGLGDSANAWPRIFRLLAGLDPEKPFPETSPGSNVVDRAKMPSIQRVLDAQASGGLDVDATAAKLAAALVASNTNGLTPADHDAVKADIVAVLNTVHLAA